MSRGTLDPARCLQISRTGLSPSMAGFPKTILLSIVDQLYGPNPGVHALRFGLFRVRSPLLTESHVVFSSSGYLDVSVPRVPLHTLWIHAWMTGGFPAVFPHSDICGLTDVCSSPQLFAAYRVLLRLSVPRHPPCALSSLTMITVLVIFPLPHSVASAVFCLLSDAPISRILLLEFFSGCLAGLSFSFQTNSS